MQNEELQRLWKRAHDTFIAKTNDAAAARVLAHATVARFRKRAPFSKRVEIAKVDEEERIAWGWAYAYVDENGQPVVDFSGQIIDAADVRKMAERFTMESRRGAEMHKSHVGYVMHSIVIDDDVAKALGVSTRKRGWYIGFKVLDDAAWAKVKDGTYKAFSIGGVANVEVLSDAA